MIIIDFNLLVVRTTVFFGTPQGSIFKRKKFLEKQDKMRRFYESIEETSYCFEENCVLLSSLINNY